MGLLMNIYRCLTTIPKDLIDESTIYMELDGENYDLLQGEINTVTGTTDLKFIEEKIQDFGKCLVFTYIDYKVVVALDKKKKVSTGNFYVAFKTKIL
jgi:hypothetical protein